jgi:magnesium transporter
VLQGFHRKGVKVMLKEMIQNSNTDLLKIYLEDVHAHDLSELFFDLTEEERLKVYAVISDEKLADLVSYMDSEKAADILSEFDLKKQKQLVEMMEPDDAADIIQELEDDEQEDLLAELGDEADVVQLIQYDEDETGSAMTNQIIVLTPDMDVKQATKLVIKEAADVETISTLFVIDDENHFLGIVPLKKLLKAKTPMPVKDIVEESHYVLDKDPIIQTVQAMNNYEINEMPVCNLNRELLGMITVDDALDIYEEEAQEDFEKLAGLPETRDMHPFKTAFHRLPWLIALLAFAIPVAMITSLFEDVLTTVAILIIFQPLISASAGNVATQTLAVTLRMFNTNEKGLVKNSFREILTGLMNGFVIGCIAFGMTFVVSLLNTSLTTQPLLISFIVGLSLWITVFIAPILAILIPLSIKALKFDPAVASGPFITTIIDVTTLIIYFGLATLILGGV